MKKSILAIAASVAVLASAPALASDQSIMFEVGFGFGHSGRVVKTEAELANNFNNKFCFHRPSSTMIYGAVRYRYDRVETHVARWFNDSDQARCERDSWAAGLGYVLDTQDINADGVDDFYATYTPGIAYTWGENKTFNVQDNTHTNWRLKDNFQMYNRVAIGGGDKDYMGEVAIVRYGNIISDDYERSGENFMTLTVGARDWDSEKPASTPAPANEFNIIIEDTTQSTEVPSEPVVPVAPPAPPVDAPQDIF